MNPKDADFLGFVWYFYQAAMYQKSEWYLFDQWSIDGKIEVKVEKRHLVVELKLKMLNMPKVTFSISTPPPGDTLERLLHFSHLWNIAQRSKFYHSDFWYVEYYQIILKFSSMYIRYTLDSSLEPVPPSVLKGNFHTTMGNSIIEWLDDWTPSLSLS